MDTLPRESVNFEYFKLFMYAWNKLHYYYKMDQKHNDHLLLPMYEDISSKVDPSKGTPSSYIFRGLRMKLRARFLLMNTNAVRRYAYRQECVSPNTESVEGLHLKKELVRKILENTKLTKGESDLLEEMFFKSMGSAEEARRNLGTPYSRSRGGQIYCSLMKKLRKTYEQLEGK